MEYYSAIIKNEILTFSATWMDLDIIRLREVIQTNKDKHMIHIYMWNAKIIQMKLFIEQKQTHRKLIYGYQRGKGWGGIN